jgi:hypothetical protein
MGRIGGAVDNRWRLSTQWSALGLKRSGIQMPKPLTFESREDLVAVLKRHDWKRDLRREHDKQPDFGLLTAVYDSVGSNTFGAFRSKEDWGPSVVFRNWACAQLLHGGFAAFERIDSNEQYRKWANSCARSLRGQWRPRLGDTLDHFRALKLINLLAKGLCVVSPLWPKRYKTVIWHIDVALDRYSLRPLSCLDIHGVDINWKTASMGAVKDIRTYLAIENEIRKVCKEAEVPPIAYDFLAWNSQHSSES